MRSQQQWSRKSFWGNYENNKLFIMETINDYGDHLQPTTGEHGADIARQRIDDLDRSALEYVLKSQKTGMQAVELGGGWGMQSVRFASLGVDTTLIDQLPPEQTVAGVDGLMEALPLQYIQADATQIDNSSLPISIDVLFSQRFIHYLTFGKAWVLLARLRDHMVSSSRLFISASGLHTELGRGYQGHGKSIDERFDSLDPAIARKHGIHESVCLYEQTELENLAVIAGYTPLSIWCSEFGNIKGVFQPQ